MRRQLTIGATCAVAMLFAAQSAAPRFDDEVRADIFAGFAGDKAAMERGMKKCEEVLAHNPKHAEAMVWYGSATGFLGGQAFQSGDSARGMELARKGRAMMDRAVELEPKSVGVRIPRGASLIGGGRFRSMSDDLAEDLKVGISDYLTAFEIQKARVDRMSTHSKGELFLGLASAYDRLGDKAKAREWFERVTEKVPESVYKKKAEKWLSGQALSPMEGTCLGCHVK